ncbi:hypothetical protein QE152_g26536 [Popillia japonica]|uniref:Uncharacterized protein n=1 Tax=Popillia japonica TaxID=7064 RepID=A0AAW1JY97_POPJA
MLNRLVRLQRLMAVHICSAYITISAEAANVIADTPPIDLLVKERRDRYKSKNKKEARVELERQWQLKWVTDPLCGPYMA